MKVKELYSNSENINIETYLKKCGVNDIKEFVEPTGKYLDDCFNYYNMDKAVEMFKSHIGDDTYILCDSGDTDGITSTVILYQYMKKIIPNWNISILIHEGKERGLQDEELFKYIQNNERPFLIIPDSGTNDYEQERQLNIDILILDHHTIVSPVTNGVLVNNQSDKNNNVSVNGSGCLVTHKFLLALDKSLECIKCFESANYIDLVALSLVSDSMNMADLQNRTYYHYGIETLDCIHNEFLKQLFIKFIGENITYTQRDIAFKVIPKLNSICRSKNRELKYILIDAFLGKDIENALEICGKAHQNQINLVNEIIDKHIDEIKNLSNNNLVLFSCDDMPRSYSGLIAGKIMGLSGGKPTIVGKIIDGELIGSLRSPIPLQGDLDNNDLVEWARGHEQSCGVLIKENNLQKLVDYYNSLNISYQPYIEVLKSYLVQDIPYDLFTLFEPYTDVFWGYGIPKPLFQIKDIKYSPMDIKTLGANKRTLKIITDYINILFFNVSNQTKVDLGLGYLDEDNKFVSEIETKPKKLNIIGTPSINVYNGKTSNQIIVDSFETLKYIQKTKENVFK